MNLLDVIPGDAARTVDEWVRARGEPPYRARQIVGRLWQRPVRDWDEAGELPRPMRAALAGEFPLAQPRLVRRQLSLDGTRKSLWEFSDGARIESVLIPEGRRRTLCISSQSGCAYACAFCATGRMGFERHLAPWEIAAQVREIRLAREPGPTHVVFMGMGEPLHNWRSVKSALTILNDPKGLGIGARRITVSTVGIVPPLLELAACPEQFRLALSLHAPTSEKRAVLMPVEKKYPLEEVVEALGRFTKRVTLEYVMIAGVNDAPEDAVALAGLARPLGALINLLPLHPGGAPELRPCPPHEMRRFARHLRRLRARVTLRKSRGLDIGAACGQLRAEVQRARGVRAQEHAHIE
ncbi:MAG: 23S rRNA (adenine(2503)-C(2))-methyltransferase RlmN [Gemmatimonadales bacterium]